MMTPNGNFVKGAAEIVTRATVENFTARRHFDRKTVYSCLIHQLSNSSAEFAKRNALAASARNRDILV